MKFEDAMQRLEEIVNLLESGKVDLDDSLKLFEEGLKLTKELDAKLKVYEKKIEDLTKEDKEDE